MFVVWGKKERRSDGGVVGDWCDICAGPRYFRLTNLYSVSHIYYIPLGSGTYVGTVRQCTQCSTEGPCDGRVYARALRHEEAMGRNIEEILQMTNPPLAEDLRRQRTFAQEMTQRVQEAPRSESWPRGDNTSLSVSAPSGQSTPEFDLGIAGGIGQARGGEQARRETAPADQRMLTALHALNAFDIRRPEVANYLEQLRKWDYLTASEREVLLYEIDGFTRHDTAFHTTDQFLKALPTPAPDWILGTGCGGWISTLIISFTFVTFLRWWLWGFLFTFATMILALIWYMRTTSRYVRAWVNKTLVPRAREAQIDLNIFLEALDAVDTNDQNLEGRIRDMVTNKDTIREELALRGMLAPPKKSGSLKY